MTTTEELYSELKGDMAALAEPLFEFSGLCLQKRGNFLPHGAVLTEQGKVELVGAAADDPDKPTNAAEILPILHGGLRGMAKDKPLVATAVAENVTITQEGQKPTPAIKV